MFGELMEAGCIDCVYVRVAMDMSDLHGWNWFLREWFWAGCGTSGTVCKALISAVDQEVEVGKEIVSQDGFVDIGYVEPPGKWFW